jgi:hypothetical protein
MAVADHENFHRAAEAVHVAQSALSKHVRDLSQSVGGPLFERTPRGVRMTFLGHILYAEAKYPLARLDGVYERARKAVGGESGRLTIGVNEMGARNSAVAECIDVEKGEGSRPGHEYQYCLVGQQQHGLAQAADLDFQGCLRGRSFASPGHFGLIRCNEQTDRQCGQSCAGQGGGFSW